MSLPNGVSRDLSMHAQWLAGMPLPAFKEMVDDLRGDAPAEHQA
jgi:hypothetical protein